MSGPEATVIIPTHDHAGTLRFSIASVLQQSFADLAVVVIGDGVGDDTRDVVAEMMRSDPRVEFVDRPKSPRVGEAIRHEVILAADSRIIAYQGDDDLWLPNHLAVMADLLDDADFAHPLPILVGVDGALSYLPTDLARPACLAWHMGEFRNAISLTGVAHTRSSYARLPWGWRQTPNGRWADHFMWQQYFGLDGLRARTSPVSTTIKLSASQRSASSAEEQTDEIQRWWKRILAEEDFGDKWQAEVARAVQGQAVSLHLADSAKADLLASISAERDSLQHALAEAEATARSMSETQSRLASAVADGIPLEQALASAAPPAPADPAFTGLMAVLRAEQTRLEHALAAVHNSTSWRLTAPMRAVGDRWRRRKG